MKEQGTIRMADLIAAGAPLGVLSIHQQQHVGALKELLWAIREDLSNSPVIAADSVAEMYYEYECQKEKTPADRFPSLNPPFNRFFVEFKGDYRVFGRQIGVMFWAKEFESAEAAAADIATNPLWERIAPTWKECPQAASETIRRIEFVSIIKNPDKSVTPLIHGEAYLFDDGTRAMLEMPMQMLGVTREVASAETRRTCDITIQPAFFAISFLHCRNVNLVESTPAPRLSKAFEKRNGKPLVRFHTLEIEAMKTILMNQGEMRKNGLSKAVHICRGHFAHYTPERPLFGRITGTVWKPAHVRGDAANGIVQKDYRLKSEAAA